MALKISAKAHFRLALICVFSFAIAKVNAQERFNVRFNSGFPNTIFASVQEVSDGYVATGILGDSLNPLATPSIFAKFDLEGEFEFQEVYGGFLDYQLFAQNPDLQLINDSILVHSGLLVDEQEISIGYLMKYNLDGDTLEMLKFYSPHIEEDYPFSDAILPIRSVYSENDGFYVLSDVIAEEVTSNDRVVQKFNSEGELQWNYFIATEADPDYVLTMTIYEDQIIIPYKLLDVGSHMLVTLDFNGDVLQQIEYDFDESTGVERDAVVFDGFLYSTSSWDNFDVPGYLPSLLKVDLQGSFQWHTAVTETDFGFERQSRHVELSADSTHLFLGGVVTREDEVWDDETAFLSKYTLDGEVLWTKKYRYLDLDYDRHELYDMRATSDGGVIFCGESVDSYTDLGLTEGPGQQGWLVKVDEHGCLVEGCEGNSISENEEEYFKVGPNPASQYLNIYLPKSSNHSTFKLYDLSGKLLHSFSSDELGTTLMMDVSEYQAGIYLLSLESSQGKTIEMKRIEVVR